ncbi:MAG TPA: SusD/RagB family nutrient-binding outer membrane lipoprotein [Gemmatimonadaceae bacterium]|nr:SusD/RagB family nutrient-binding outer membrane lipoprotein [Gemmatimonadaceae bacterium]
MNTAKRFALLGVLAIAGTTGACNSFLTGGELTTDPNRPTSGSPQARFAAVQVSLWALLSSDPARIMSVWTQQFAGVNMQYSAINDYVHDETTTGGFEAGLYTGGGLVDIREIESEARASGDSVLLGQTQVLEGLMIGTGADLFGDLVYSQALSNTPNPPLDNQMDVYDALQTVLADAITNMTGSGPTNFGAGSSDLVYGGDVPSWTAFAHTVRARLYLHTAEVRPAAYGDALTQAEDGITDPSGDYKAIWSGNLAEQNFWYQFFGPQRPGYMVPGPFLVTLLQTNSDPRLAEFFNAAHTNLSATRADPTFSQPLVTAQENLLIWAEAAYRTGATGTALTQLNAAKDAAASVCHDETGSTCVIPHSAASGSALLHDILTEKYIAEFQNIEAWNDYKRTCFPNLTPTVVGFIIPGRLFYDQSERQTDTSIPAPTAQPTRNANDPANATDDFGIACKGQTPS